MRKIQILGLAVLAVFAFSAFAASSASAVSKLLFENAEISALLNATITGSLLLEDTLASLKFDVLCTGIFDVMIEAGGTLVIVEALLMSDGTLLNELGELNGAGNDMIDCTTPNTSECLGEVLVTVLNLPWHVEIILDNALQYLAHFLNGTEEAGKEPEYDVLCINSLLGELEDKCNGLSSARLDEVGGQLLGYFNQLALTELFGAASELTTCTLGGAGSGLLESEDTEGKPDTEASGGLIADENGSTAFTLSE